MFKVTNLEFVTCPFNTVYHPFFFKQHPASVWEPRRPIAGPLGEECYPILVWYRIVAVQQSLVFFQCSVFHDVPKVFSQWSVWTACRSVQHPESYMKPCCCSRWALSCWHVLTCCLKPFEDWGLTLPVRLPVPQAQMHPDMQAFKQGAWWYLSFQFRGHSIHVFQRKWKNLKFRIISPLNSFPLGLSPC